MPRLLPVWLHWYQKPSYRDPATFTKTANADVEEGLRSRPPSISSQSDAAIPPNLSLDRVLAGATCSPLSLYDFYMYLKHIELSPENLEFYMWYKDYEARYREGSHSDMPSQMTPLLVAPGGEKSGGTYTTYAGIGGDDWDKRSSDAEFETYIRDLVLAQETKKCRPFWGRASESSDKTLARAYSNREEVQNVASMFLQQRSPKELNLPSNMRNKALAALDESESPAVLAPIADHVYYLLRNCSHRNFVRLGIKNGTFETLCMVTIVGVMFTTLGLLTMLLVAFASPSIHHSSRWRGLAAAPFWVVGFSFLLAGWRGSCFLLLLFSRRQELPWERIEDDSSIRSRRPQWAIVRFGKKMMLFDRKVRVKDQGLRELQRKIVVQSVIGAFIIAAVLEVVFLVLPIWK